MGRTKPGLLPFPSFRDPSSASTRFSRATRGLNSSCKPTRGLLEKSSILRKPDPWDGSSRGAATGTSWGLAAAQFALMAAKMGVVSLGAGAIIGTGIAAAVIAGIGTYVAAASLQSYYAGTAYG